MAEFEPVGVRAVVKGAEKFIADLNAMTTAVVQFYATASRQQGVFTAIQQGASSAQTQFTGLATASNAAAQATQRVAVSSNTASSGVRGLALYTGTARQQVELLGQRLAFLATRNIENANATNRAIAGNAHLRGQLIQLIAAKDRLLQKLAREQSQLARLEGAYTKSNRGYQSQQRALKNTELRINKLHRSMENKNLTMDKAERKHRKLIRSLSDLENATERDNVAIGEMKRTIAESNRQIEGYKADIVLLQREINELGHKHVETREDMERHAAGMDQFGSEASESRQRIAALTAEIGRVDQSIDKIRRLGTALAVLKKAFSTAASAAKMFGKALLLPQTLMKGLGDKMLAMNARVEQWSRNWFKMGNSIRFFGMSMVFLVSMPIVGFFGGLINSAIKFEDAFAGVIKTVDGLVKKGTLNELNDAGLQLQRNFRELALQIPISAIELANLGQVAGQLGVRGVSNITAFVDAVARIGAATDLSSEDAGRFLAQIIAIAGPMSDAQLKLAGFNEEVIAGLEPEEKFQAQIQAVGGTLVALGNNLPTTEESIARFAQRIAASGKLANLATQDIFGIAAAFSSVGVPAERGGTAVQKTFIKIIEAIQSGGDALKIFAKTSDLSVETFTEAFTEGSDRAGWAFERFIRGLGENSTRAITILDALGLNNQRVINSLLSVANAAATSGEENARMAESIEIAKEAFKKFGDELDDYNALQLESERRFATTSNQIKLMKNQLTDLGITVGAVVLPTLRKVVDVLREVARRIELLGRTEGGKKLIQLTIIIAGITAVIGPLIVAFGLLMSAIGFIGLAISKLVLIIGSLFSWFGLLAFPIAGVVAALVGLAIAFAASFRKIDQISGEAAKGMIPAMWEFGKELILAFARGMAAAIGAVIQVLIAIGEVLRHWLAPGSPPRIAPDLDKWGEEAMNTYMRSWLNADFDIFNTLANKVESYLRSMSRKFEDTELIERIMGSRKAVAEAVDEIKRIGKVTTTTLKKIHKIVGSGQGLISDYVDALLEVAVAQEKVSAAQRDAEQASKAVERIQRRLVALNKEYDASLKPLNDRLKVIADRQKEVADAQRIQELEQILADPRATSLVKELASLEIEQIGLENQVKDMEDVRDLRIEELEAELAVAEAQQAAAEQALGNAEEMLKMAEEQVKLAENMFDFQIKNNQLMDEYAKALEQAEDSAKGLVDDIGGLLDEIDSELEDMGFGELGEELFTGIDSAVGETIQKISDAFEGLVSELGDIFAPLIPMWERLGDVWAPIFETVLDKLEPLKTAVGGLKGAFDGVMESVSTLADRLVAFLVNMGVIDMPASFMQSLEDAEKFEFVLDPVSGGGAMFDQDVQDWGVGLQERAAEITAAFESPLADFGTKLAEPWEKAKGTIQEWWDLIKAAFQEVGRLVKEYTPVVVGFGIELLETITGREFEGIPWIDGAKAAFEDFLDSPFITTIENIFAPWLSVWNSLYAQLKEKIIPAFQEIKEPLQILKERFGELVEAIAGEGGGGKIIGIILKIWQYAGTLLGGVIGGIFAGVARGIIGIIKAIVGFLNGVVLFWTGVVGVIKGFVDIIKGLWNIITGNFDEGVALIQGAFEQILQGGIDAFMGLLQGAIGILSGLWEALRGIFWGIVDTVVGAFEHLKEILIGNSIIPDMVTGIIEWIMNLITTVITAIWDFVWGIINAFIKLATDVLAAIVQFALDIWNAFTGMIADIIEAITNFVTDGTTSFTDLVTTIIETVTGFVSDVFDAFTGLFTDVIDAVAGFVGDVVTSFIDMVTDIIEAVAGLITDGPEKIREFGEGLKDKALEIVSNAAEWAKDIGEAIINGLKNALTDGIGAVGDAISGVAGGAIDAAKNFFGIGSPSKEFEEIGKFTLEGWIIGMQKQKQALEKIVMDMARNLLGLAEDLAEGMDRISSRSFADSLNDTKSWVLDLYGVYEGLFDGIGDMFVDFAEEFFDNYKTFLSAIIDASIPFGQAMAIDGEESLWGSIFQFILNDFLLPFVTDFIELYAIFADDVIMITNNIFDAFKQKESAFRGIGENLINALASGMEARRGHLMSVAQGIADGLRSTISSALEVTSPSKVFYEIGENIMSGWMRGMSDNEGALVSTMQGLTNSMLALGGQSPAPQGVLATSAPVAMMPAPVPHAQSVTNAEINMGGQTITNGLDTIRLQIALEQALRNVL